MRSLFLLAALCCLVLSVYASPVSRPEDDKEVGRQAAAPAAAAPAASADDDDDEDDDDDDDDDDDVDIDLPVDDDDDDDEDDDEDEADDDEEDDYLERFFDDILGGGEDDDDDETVAAVQPVAAPVDTVAAAPATTVVEEAAAASEEVEASETEPVVEGEETEVQKDPSSAETDTAAAASAETAAATETETEDDDEDEDDITDALGPEDDDDEEEDEEEDDDEEDDVTDAFGRNVAAKHSRALTEEPNKESPEIFVPVPVSMHKGYNILVDHILEKMNDILRKSYDPVNVKLQPIDASKKSSKPKKNKKKSNKRKSSTKKNARRNSTKNKVKSTNIEDIKENVQINDVTPIENIIEEITGASEIRAIKDTKAKPTTVKTKPPTKATKPKPKPKPPTKTTTKKPVTTKNKTKTGEKSKPRAKGTLYGLSSLRRKGDVSVKIEANYTSVKSNFAVGPLVLRVEKEVGRGAKKELKSATATTEEMIGKLSFRVSHKGVATLHSIKVLQPKQVRVVSNHERTRELAWQRSYRIAHVVSEKLLSVSRPVFNQNTVVKQ